MPEPHGGVPRRGGGCGSDRFEARLYRCVQPSGDNEFVRAWTCTGGSCRYEVAPTLGIETITNELDCDERLLANPPADECFTETWDWMFTPPENADDEWIAETYTLHFPYLSFEQAAVLEQDVEGGAGVSPTVESILGNQVTREREIDVTFDPAAPVGTHADLTDAGCVDLEVPDLAMQ